MPASPTERPAEPALAQPDLAAERRVVALVVLVQFVHIVDLTMILPLGPDFAASVHIPPASLGLLTAAYGGAAALVGAVAAPQLDRLDRRTAMVAALVGLTASTLCGAAAVGLTTMVAARIVAGAFGGPAASLGQSIVTDAVPEERRGRAMGVVMGANALAAVLGVPFGLWLAGEYGAQAPFLAVGVVTAAVAAASWALLPPMRAHFVAAGTGDGLADMLRRPPVVLAYALVCAVVFSSYLLTPNLSAFAQINLGLPRGDLPKLYAVAGCASIVTMRVVGWMVDRWGSLGVGSGAVAGFIVFAVAFLLAPRPLLPVGVGFVLLLVALSSRNVAVRTLATRVPGRHERARFLSLQSSVQHASSALGSLASAAWLTARPDGSLVGMAGLGAVAIALTAAVPPLLWVLESQVEAEA